MLRATINFACKLCGQTKNWYITPLKEKAGDSYIHSKTHYRITCKKCGKEYILKFNIKAI